MHYSGRSQRPLQNPHRSPRSSTDPRWAAPSARPQRTRRPACPGQFKNWRGTPVPVSGSCCCQAWQTVASSSIMASAASWLPAGSVESSSDRCPRTPKDITAAVSEGGGRRLSVACRRRPAVCCHDRFPGWGDQGVVHRQLVAGGCWRMCCEVGFWVDVVRVFYRWCLWER